MGMGFLLVLGAAWAAEEAADLPPPRGGEVAWARLETRSDYWDRHAEYDGPVATDLIQLASLKLAPEVPTASAESIDRLSPFPFIFAQSIAELNAGEMRHLAEYLRRGGFIFVNPCRAERVNPDRNLFLRQQLERLRAALPTLRAVTLAPNHPLFSCYYKIKETPSFPRSGSPAPYTALYDGDDLVGLIGLLGIQCTWQLVSGEVRDARIATGLEFFTNIYVYAMNH